MADNETYISDLSQIIEIKPADSFIVETTEGTKRILWQDIIVGQDNVDFYNIISQNEVDILTLSANQVALSATTTSLTNSVTALSSDNTLRDQYGWAYVELDDSGNIDSTDTANSLNITNIETINVIDESGDEVNALLITAPDIDFTSASVCVTLNNPKSASTTTDSFVSYTPKIFSRTNGTLTIGCDAELHTVESATLVSGVTLTTDPETVNVASGINTTYVNSLSILDVGVKSISPSLASAVGGAFQAITYQGTDLTISVDSSTFNYQGITKLIGTILRGNADTTTNQGVNLQIRY